MTLSVRERRLLTGLGLLVGLAALRLVWLASQPPAASGSPPAVLQAGAPRAARSGRAAAEPPKAVVLLATDRLQPTATDFAVGRDLFRFGAPPPPPPPEPPTRAELERRRQLEEERQQRAQASAIEAARPKPPPVTVKYLGNFGPNGVQIAVFTDAQGKNLWNARVGDVVDGKFIVDRIGLESVDLRFVGFEELPPARLAVGE